MFTGLVADLGTVTAVDATDGGVRLNVKTSLANELKLGDSVAVNGVCLTATSVLDGAFSADVMHESLRRSSLAEVAEGSNVNLELPLRAADRLGGHVVQGHVDGVGVVADPLDVEAERARRLGDALGALTLERVAGAGAAEHHRGDEEADLVDLAGVEERAGQARPALEQDRGDAVGAQLVERGADARGLVLPGGDDDLRPGRLERAGGQARGGPRHDDGEGHLGGAAQELGGRWQPRL